MKWVFWGILVSGLLFLSGYLYFVNKPNTDVISISDEIYLIIEDIIVDEGNPIHIIDESIYLSFDFIKKYIDDDLFYDEDEEILIISNKDSVKRFKINELKASINSKEYFIDNPVLEFDNGIYLPLSLIELNYEISINYYNSTNAVVVDFKDIYYLKGNVILENAVIRTDMNIKAPILEDNLELLQEVYVYGEYKDWLKIRTMDGVLGFIDKKFIRLNHTKDIYKTQLINRSVDNESVPNKINLTWDYTYSRVKSTDNIKEIPGLNVISPTWFSITSENGTIQDKGNIDYVAKYKNLGYELWPLIDNSFDPDLTHNLLKSSILRERLILDIVKLYSDYGFQGINIDFENIHLKDRDLLTQFVRELYPIFKEHNMIVTMDITPISTSENWSMCYDRERLHKTVDYIMLMAYDQHWAASPIAGSVAEYGWVEKSIKRSLEIIPNEKLILAVPFYTRLWTIEGDKISSKSLSMDNANNFIQKNNINMVWDEDVAQYYGELINEEKEYRIWLEDEKSLGYKISLVHKYNLAGISSWRKGFESENIWASINRNLN